MRDEIRFSITVHIGCADEPPEKEIDRYSRLHAEHTVQYFTLKQLVEDIEIENKITPEMEKRFLDARDRHAQLSKDDDVKPSKRLARRCEAEVKKEIPSDRLWVPKEGDPSHDRLGSAEEARHT